MENYNSTHTGAEMDSYVTKQELIDLIYPVGSIYISVNSVSPATLFGGTWEQIQDRFLLSAGNQYPAGSIGGASENSHSHQYGLVHGGYYRTFVMQVDTNAGLVNYDNENNMSLTTWTELPKLTATVNDSVTTTYKEAEATYYRHIANVSYSTINNMPPYLAVNIWKRIS